MDDKRGSGQLIFSTGYYVAWFFGLALLIFAPIAGTLAWPQLRAWWGKNPPRVLGLGLVAGLGFVGALSIFVIIYAPVLLSLGSGRQFDEYLYYAPHPIDIVNVGMNNLLWSGLIRALNLIPDGELGFGEKSMALTPVVQVLLLLSAILALRPRFWPATDAGRISRAFVLASAGVCVVFFLLMVQTHHYSLFRFVYATVPGARAIRTAYRGMIVANLFAVTAIALTSDRIIGLSSSEPRLLARLGRRAALALLLALAAIEQLNFAETSLLSRINVSQRLNAVGSVPSECQSFYVALRPDRPTDAQARAMMIAMDRNLPTLNGISGISPPNWDLFETSAPNYEQRVVRWAHNRRIAEGLCRLDLDSGTWTVVERER